MINLRSTMNLISRTAVAAIALAAVLGTGAAPIPAASASARPAVITSAVLVQYPRPRICLGHHFTVGVWSQSGTADRAYRVAVYNPAHQRVLYRHGRAPTSRWKLWRVHATKAGRYHTIYHADGVRVRYPTRSHNCG